MTMEKTLQVATELLPPMNSVNSWRNSLNNKELGDISLAVSVADANLVVTDRPINGRI